MVTLWSGGTFGVANYGRMYLPTGFSGRHPNQAGANPAECVDLVTLVRTMLRAQVAEVSTLEQDCDLAIFSFKGTGTHKIVQDLKVGTIIDAQRRRRNADVEVYSSVAWAD